MPTESSLPYIVIPDSDLWAFLFERNDRPYPDDKGQSPRPVFACLADQFQSSTVMPILTDPTRTPR